ncbi:hypothetical protein KNO15_03370 [Leifsonia shinshuensis]|uniref:hypothetical protein n=1 Tax=Leifsonia shinshuensis TaxID=150026 RepID=UPI001F5093A1|nr:hypothetical protein [Leifsonia shinshuensis]MCI0155736.1 hypothetical protein [Leifsonia shinshuensis]
MGDLGGVIGDDPVLELSFSSRYGQGATELWEATLKRLDYEDDDYDDEGTETVLATAQLARVDLSGHWLDSLDAESGSLEAVGGAFFNRGRIAAIDEESTFATSLVIVDYIEVVEEYRGFRISHDFIRGIARIFRDDLIALTPARMAGGDSDELVEDVLQFEGLLRHWERIGFVQVPETDVMLLPRGKR